MARHAFWELMRREVWEWDVFDPLMLVVAKVWLSLTAFAVLLAALGVWASVQEPPTPLSHGQAMEAQNKARGRLLNKRPEIDLYVLPEDRKRFDALFKRALDTTERLRKNR